MTVELNAKSPRAGNRLLELDAFRGLASLGVVLYHYFYYYFEIIGDPAEGIEAFHVGRYGVELFFIISGFVIFLTLERTKSVMDFVVSRAARLFPVYWLAIIITTIVIHSFGLEARNEVGEMASRAVPLVPTLANFTMLEEYGGFAKVDGAYWTLTFELSFYIIAGTAFFCGFLKRFHLAAAIALLAFAGASLSGFAVPFKIETFFLLKYGHLFLLGMLLYRVFKGDATPATWTLMLPAIALQFMNHEPVTAWLVLGFTITFLAFLKGWLRFLAIRPLIFLGAISYSLYIVHQYAGYVLMRELLAAGLPLLAVQLLTSAVAILVATGMTYLVERPANRAVRTWWKARSTPRTTSAIAQSA